MKKKEDMETIFEEQLKKCNVDYFDFYLIHSIGKEAYENCKKCMKVCPQKLPIPKYLEEYIVAELESYNPEAHIKK